MKTYCERAQDILRRLEIYEKQKQKRQKRLYMGLALAACLAVAVCAAAVLPPSFIGRNGRPRRIRSCRRPPSPLHSRLSHSVRRVPIREYPTPLSSGKMCLLGKLSRRWGWNLVPCENEEFLGYVLLSLDKPRRPIGLIYQFQNGSVQILSDARGGEEGLDIRRVSYRGREFLVPARTAETTALYREGNLTYTASFTGVTQEETFESILSLLIS